MNKKYLAVLILTPVFAVTLVYRTNYYLKDTDVQNKEPLDKLPNIEEKDKEINVELKINDEVLNIALEDYIIGVVAAEMPASFELEALKAQAVASRTYALYKLYNNLSLTLNDQAYINKEKMKEKWGEDYDLYYSKINQAIDDTKGEYMLKNNKIFKAYYFAMSNGYTEDSVLVFGENLLNSVKSPWDNETLNKFEVETQYSSDELMKMLNLNEITNLEIVSRDSTNHVEKVKVNNNIISGIEFRQLLSLRSTDFEIQKLDDSYLITTKGYGHGVGMSQYGANGMAKENKNYKEILEYFYQEIEIKTI